MIIDSHQHFWNPARGDYDWMPKGDPVLDRIYRPADLVGTLVRHNIDGTVLVQAAATVAETEYMLGLADASDFIKGVVGWVDFENPADAKVLERLKGHPKFKGVRPMIQDIPDDDWMLRPDVQWGYAALADLDLTFDALGFPRHLAHFLTILKRYPTLRCVIDHCMKPQIRDPAPEVFTFWADGMARLAGETAACVKFSALITEATPEWTVDTLRPYVEHILKVFGPQRIMWGSDWPVCRLRAEYNDWLGAARQLTAHLSLPDQKQIYGGTAEEFYGL
ncbi:MAG: amidohydrolase family protein [Cypionkella sp.]